MSFIGLAQSFVAQVRQDRFEILQLLLKLRHTSVCSEPPSLGRYLFPSTLQVRKEAFPTLSMSIECVEQTARLGLATPFTGVFANAALLSLR